MAIDDNPLFFSEEKKLFPNIQALTQIINDNNWSVSDTSIESDNTVYYNLDSMNKWLTTNTYDVSDNIFEDLIIEHITKIETVISAVHEVVIDRTGLSTTNANDFFTPEIRTFVIDMLYVKRNRKQFNLGDGITFTYNFHDNTNNYTDIMKNNNVYALPINMRFYNIVTTFVLNHKVDSDLHSVFDGMTYKLKPTNTTTTNVRIYNMDTPDVMNFLDSIATKGDTGIYTMKDFEVAE
jgi:hypothetical protein